VDGVRWEGKLFVIMCLGHFQSQDSSATITIMNHVKKTLQCFIYWVVINPQIATILCHQNQADEKIKKIMSFSRNQVTYSENVGTHTFSFLTTSEWADLCYLWNSPAVACYLLL
jgi:hypothetical protein